MTPLQVKLIGFGALLAMAAVALGFHWQPERQVRLHTTRFLTAAEKRSVRKLEALVDPAYADDWGYRKTNLIPEMHEVLRQFFVLTVRAEELKCTVSEQGGQSSFRLKIEGSGTAVADLAERQVNGISAPFIMSWRHRSWRPWDWTLVRVQNEQLRVRPHETFDSIF